MQKPRSDDGPAGDDRRQQTRQRLLNLARIALALAIGAVGSALFVWLETPLPVFMGALTFSIIASVVNLPVARPTLLSRPMRMVLGVAIGSAFTPAVLARMDEMALSLALMVPYSYLIVATGYVFFRRFAGFDSPTAFFVSVPGGLADMVTMSADAGANERQVTLVQAVRMATIVFSVPVFVQLWSGTRMSGRMTNVVHIGELGAIDAALLVGLGVAGWWIAKRLGIAGAAIVGPMVMSGVFHASGLTAAKVPVELLIVAQLSLAVLLGCQFQGVTVREFTSWIVWGFIFALIVLVGSIVAAMLVARLTSADEVSVLLAYCPGGQSEINLLALVLHLDVAFIALHHLVRVFSVVIGAQVFFSLRPDWRGGKASNRDT